MRKTEPRRMRSIAMVVFLLVGCGVLAAICLKGGISCGPDRAGGGAASDGASQRRVVVPVSSLIPAWVLGRKAVPVSPDRNAGVLKNVLEVFNPSLRPFLASVPIVLDSSANTATAYRSRGYIGVNPDWDNTVAQSKYREIYEERGMKPGDPVFEHRFKTDLLIHEFLHILQARLHIDAGRFYEAVARWYLDPRYGVPAPNSMVRADAADGRQAAFASNRIKYVVWYQLYDYPRLKDVPRDDSWKDMRYVKKYRWSGKGVEEFAYIGEEILSSGSGSDNYIRTGQWCDKDWKSKKMRLAEVSPEIASAYSGIFNPALTR